MAYIRLNARECEIINVSKQEEKDFLNKNHRQNYARSSLCYGLYFKNKLVQLMSFGKPRFNKNYQWEIIRDCSKDNYLVRGGVSKLWKHFLSNNTCRSCICYSYPHENDFTSKYISNCDFKNLSKKKPSKAIFYTGSYNGKEYNISIAQLNRSGVDRILGTKFGFDHGTNEEILFSLGFEKHVEDSFSPQIDIYYPFGVVYRTDDLTDGSFYIGMCEDKNSWDNGYLGSGTLMRRHLEAHPNKSLHKNRRNKDAHLYKRTILKDNFITPKDTRKYEVNEISKFLKNVNGKNVRTDERCLNLTLREQISGYVPPVCEECGGKMGRHKKSCSKYKELDICPECGLAYNQHKSDCSRHKEDWHCKECNGKNGMHKKTCSQYKRPEPCKECGGIRGHKKTCSKFVQEKGCTCGSPKGGFHKKGCLLYKETVCPECGGKSNNHKKYCSKYKENHKCEICGSSTVHYKGCPNSKHKTDIVCEECGWYDVGHSPDCSKRNATKNNICPECNGKNGKHKKFCSKYVKKICLVCGSVDGHKRGCPNSSKYKENPDRFKNICVECGFHSSYHSDSCSLRHLEDRFCKVCGGKNGEHKSWCKCRTSVCPECGGIRGHHKPGCYHYKICPICGGRDGRHRSYCKTISLN